MKFCFSFISCYCISFRGIGEAHRLLKAQLVAQSQNSQFVIHPCYPRGLVTNETHTDIFSAQCTGYLDKEKFVHKPRYQLQGTGDVDQCRAHVRKIFADPTGKCPFQDDDCSFNSQLKPMNISGPFMARVFGCGFFCSSICD